MTDASLAGLDSAEAGRRLKQFGANTLTAGNDHRAVRLLVRQFASPIVALLIVAALLSAAVHDTTDGVIILVIIAVSCLLGFWQEYKAATTVAALMAAVELRALVLRDGREVEIPVAGVVPGDVVILRAGSGVAADCRLLVSHDLFVNEAALTGESFPVEKTTVETPPDAPLARRTNAVFMGTHVISGTAKAVVVHTAASTEFGGISARLRVKPPATEFERGVRRFGYFLIELTLLLVTVMFAVNVYLAKPVLDSFLFALALAVGLTPQLLPAIVSVNLARGAKRMADRRVIVKRLTSIENFGSMNVLCSDKTGTLTEGRVRVDRAVDALGRDSARVLWHAYVNATFQQGYTNPIDAAICERNDQDLSGWTRLDEIPYDFTRRRLSVLATSATQRLLVTKGSLSAVLDVCALAESGPDGRVVPLDRVRDEVLELQKSFEQRGFRTLGVAVRTMSPAMASIARDDERDMTWLGMLVLQDPPKAGAAAAVQALARLGVALKIITGDSAVVAEKVARDVGVPTPVVLTGAQLQTLDDEALRVRAATATVFAEIEPGQKERVIRAVKAAGYVVGYLGDGINDAAALHAADVGISVQDAADVAKAAADIVLLEQDLGVLEEGVREGRRTFANTMKYVFMATSANFGNMFSMAGASVLLPFLPLLPKQILLLNILTDLPELTIATDRVDPELIERPRRWDVRFIRRFMLVFGILSSVFDYATFALLLWWLHASPVSFQTAWFIESIVSAVFIVLVVRTRRSMLSSLPSAPLVVATVVVAILGVTLPYSPAASLFGFAPVPPAVLGPITVIVVLYVLAAERVKGAFYASRES